MTSHGIRSNDCCTSATAAAIPLTANRNATDRKREREVKEEAVEEEVIGRTGFKKRVREEEEEELIIRRPWADTTHVQTHPYHAHIHTF